MQQPTAEPAFVFNPDDAETLDVMGPTIQFISSPRHGEPCVMRGIIPPGMVIPIHSHPDPETFIQLSGKIEALTTSDKGFAWEMLTAGSVFHVPGNVRHAFRNPSTTPSVGIIATTARLGEFFVEIGRPIEPGLPLRLPTEETFEHFLAAARRYAHWIGTAEDNGEAGIMLPKR